MGQFGHRRALAALTVLAAGRLPDPGAGFGGEDGGLDLGVGARHGHEADVAGSHGGYEIMGGAGRVSARHQLAANQARVVAGVVAGRDVFWQGGDGRVQHLDVIFGGVGSGVTRPQHSRHGIPAAIRETQQRMKPEPLLVGGGRPFLVLGVHLDQGGVDVQIGRFLALHEPGLFPHLGSGLADRPHQRAAHLGCDLLGDHPFKRRVRRHRPEDLRLGAQHLDVTAGLATPGQHQRGVHHHLPSVVNRQPLTPNRDHRGEQITQP